MVKISISQKLILVDRVVAISEYCVLEELGVIIFYFMLVTSYCMLQAILSIINQKQVQKMDGQKWSSFCEEHHWNPDCGFLVDPQHAPASFSYELIKGNLQNLYKKTKEEIYQIIENFPDIGLKTPYNFTDMMLLKDILIIFLNTYIVNKKQDGFKTQELKIPKNLAKPLYLACEFNKVKYGMSINICYNLQPINNVYKSNPENFGFDDFELRYYLTNEPEQQKYFFGGSIIGAVHLSQIVHAIFNMKLLLSKSSFGQEDIQIFKRMLKVCSNNMNKIFQENQKMFKKLDTIYFYHKLRTYVVGFDKLCFQGANNGNDMILSSTGGSGSYDPSFQLFQAAFSIQFKDELKQTQQSLLDGIAQPHRALISKWKNVNPQESIRNFCKHQNQLKQFYNQVVRAYARFLQMHGAFIQVYILKHLNIKKQATGTSGITISKMITRHQVVTAHLL